MRTFNKGDKRPVCKNDTDLMLTPISKINRIITLDFGDFLYCFSCADILGFNDSTSSKYDKWRKWYPAIPQITNEQIDQLINFKKDCENASDSDEEDESESKENNVVTASDAIPYIKKLGIYDFLNKKILVNRPDEFLRDRFVEEPVDPIVSIKETNSKFVKKYKLVGFPVFEFGSDNLSIAAIKYYQNIYDYLNKLYEEGYTDIKENYINMFKTNTSNRIILQSARDGAVRIANLSQLSEYDPLSIRQISFERGVHLSFEDFDFTPFENLETLNLRRTLISSLHSVNFTGLKSLKTLNASEANIESLVGVNFTGLENLKKLNLSDNPIKVLEGVNFAGLDNLEELNLTKTQLNSVGGSNINILKKLKMLILNHNPITTLNGINFAELPKLTSLFVYDTHIKSEELINLGDEFQDLEIEI